MMRRKTERRSSYSAQDQSMSARCPHNGLPKLESMTRMINAGWNRTKEQKYTPYIGCLFIGTTPSTPAVFRPVLRRLENDAMKKPCNHPGCPTLIERGAYCPTHAATRPNRHKDYDRHVRHRDPALAEAARIRSSPRWQQVRRQMLADHPMCQDPYGDHARAGMTRTATQVHHIEGLASRPELAFHRSNLLTVCSACHARLEREVRRNPSETPKAPPEQSSREWTPFG